MKDFDNLYIKVNIADKEYDILCFTFVPVKTIVDYYDNINDIEEFVRQSLYLIHLTLKDPTQFNSIKTGLTFDELFQFMENWVKQSLYYNEWLKGNVNNEGEVKPAIRLKTYLNTLILLAEAKEVSTEEEHLLFIQMFSDELKKHVKHYNKLTKEKKIRNIKIEVENGDI